METVILRYRFLRNLLCSAACGNYLLVDMQVCHNPVVATRQAKGDLLCFTYVICPVIHFVHSEMLVPLSCLLLPTVQ